LASNHPASPAAIDQGHELALWVLAATAVAMPLRAALTPADRRLRAIRLPHLGWRSRVVAGGAAIVAGLVLALVADLPGTISHEYDRFVEGNTLPVVATQRDRLTDVGNNGRLEHWKVASAAFARQRLAGHGAGTFALLWDKGRPRPFQALDAHSLYAETAAELGLLGLALIIGTVGLLVIALVVRCRGEGRGVPAIAAALLLLWAVHAGIDWDWEMPAVTLPVLVLAAAAIATAKPAVPRPVGRTVRVVVGLGCLVLSVIPLQMAYSQRELNTSVHAFRQGNCPQVVTSALRSTKAIGARPEPFQLLSFCDVRFGLDRLAVRMADQAVANDPGNWEFRYSRALVRGAVRLDPRADAREALRLNPHQRLAQQAARAFRTRDPDAWKLRARSATLPIQD
jgi:hypothetical protein